MYCDRHLSLLSAFLSVLFSPLDILFFLSVNSAAYWLHTYSTLISSTLLFTVTHTDITYITHSLILTPHVFTLVSCYHSYNTQHFHPQSTHTHYLHTLISHRAHLILHHHCWVSFSVDVVFVFMERNVFIFVSIRVIKAASWNVYCTTSSSSVSYILTFASSLCVCVCVNSKKYLD